MRLSLIRWFFLLMCAAVLALPACKKTEKISRQQRISDGNAKLQEDYFYLNAAKQKILGNYQAALDTFLICIKINPQNHAAMYEAASLLEYQHRDRDALALVTKAVKLEPNNPWYLILQGNIYAKNGLFAEAAGVYEKLTTNFPENLEYKYELAGIYLYAGKYKQALETYDRIEKQIGITGDVSLQIEQIHLKNNDIEAAIKEIEKLVAALPEELSYMGVLAELYLQTNRKEEALQLYEKMKAIDPDNPQIAISKSNYYRIIGEHDKSFEELKKAFSSEQLPIDTKIQILLSNYSVTDNFEALKAQAYQLTDILLEVHPDEAKTHSIRGDFFYREHKLPEAINAYEKAVEIDPSRFIIWSQICQICLEMNDYPCLEVQAGKALNFFPEQPVFYLYKGLAQSQEKNHEQAIKTLTNGLVYVIDNNLLLSQFYSTIGEANHSLKNWEASDTAFTTAIRLHPEDANILNNYAYYLSVRGVQLETAELYSKKSNKLAPGVSSYEDTYGWVLFMMGNYEEAEKWLKKAMESGGRSSGTILEHYGDVLYKLGKPEEAVEYWENAANHGVPSELLKKKIANRSYYEE